MERTLIIFKPDAVQRGLMGEILSRFERKGIQVVGAKLIKIPTSLAETHYEPHKGKGFYAGLVRFMTTSPVLVLALQGKDVITIARKMMGATFGSKAEPGTIRGDYGVSNSFNLIHGSDSPEAAERELKLFFKGDELVDWTPASQGWVYDMAKGSPE
ncbi:MAG: nucleoside-diphosphate kinase [Anaerolineae bacterium]|nr:nucleoside-diphosphate kinase [Phycisphaerae bacterium]